MPKWSEDIVVGTLVIVLTAYLALPYFILFALVIVRLFKRFRDELRNDTR